MAEGLTSADIFRVYYDVPASDRAGMRWVLSKDTVAAIVEAFGPAENAVPHGWTGETQLLGRPVRIDDAAEGLAFEILPHKLGIIYDEADA